MPERQNAINAFLADNGWQPEHRTVLAEDASFRRYERLADGNRVAVLMDAPPLQEDTRLFIRIAEHLLNLGLSTPKIYAQNTNQGFLLLEDFGDDTYTRVLDQSPAQEQALYELAVDTLIHLHKCPVEQQIPKDWPEYDLKMLLGEVRIFTDWYLPHVSSELLAPDALIAYETIWEELFGYVQSQPKCLVLRDFHVDNMISLDGKPGIKACGLLDFQDALVGARAYDLMSLLEDARRDMDDHLMYTLKARYYAAFDELAEPGAARHAFDAIYAILGAGRHAKVIGIFIRLLVRDGKPNYLIHIPRVWRLLERSLGHPIMVSVRDWFDVYVPSSLRDLPPTNAYEDT